VNVEAKLKAILAAIQVDVGNRGLGRDPAANLFNACPDDFAGACRSLAEHPAPVLGVVTGFWIPAARLGETDGPLGAVYLARTLPAMGVRASIVSDPFCRPALQAGLQRAGVDAPLLDLPGGERAGEALGNWWEVNHHAPPTHVLALERVGPSHTPKTIREAQASRRVYPGGPDGGDKPRRSPEGPEESVRRFEAEVPCKHHGRCHTMRGVDITDFMCDPGFALECEASQPVTIGIGDGGNEIGMGKVPWDVIRRNIPNGAVIACGWRTDYLIVAGISNWGAYALAAGVALLCGYSPPDSWFDIETERGILQEMVEQGPLVDGVKGIPSISVDGLDFETYIEPLRRIAAIVRA
jgi:hypothetical protein